MGDTSHHLKPRKDFLPYVIAAAAAVAVGVLGFYFYWFRNRNISHNSGDWAALGSYASGLLGPLFSLLGVILIYLTFRTQKKNADLQQFEATFFNLLSTQRDIVKSLYGAGITPHGTILGTTPGYAYLRAAAQDLQGAMEANRYNIADDDVSKLDNEQIVAIKPDVEAIARSNYNKMYGGREGQLDHYFRHLYHIVKYTDGAYIPDEEKREYVDIVQAQMSDDELYLAFYNGIGQYGYPNFWRLMEKYQFTENMRDRGAKSILTLHKQVFYPVAYA